MPATRLMEAKAKSAKSVKNVSLHVEVPLVKNNEEEAPSVKEHLSPLEGHGMELALVNNGDQMSVIASPENKEKDRANLNSENRAPTLSDLANKPPIIGIDIPIKSTDNNFPNNEPATNVQSSPTTSNSNANWASRVKGSNHSNNGMKLQHFPNTIFHEKPCKIPEEIGVLGESQWETSMIGYFLDKNLPFSLVRDITLKIWSKFGITDVMPCGKGFFLFKFATCKGRDDVIELGPWHIVNKAIFLKKWDSNLNLSKEEFKTVPIWIKLYDIPLKYWTGLGLSYIASMLGVPFSVDDMTAGAKRLVFARILIEMSVNSAFPSNIQIESDNGDVFNINVEYSWTPKSCELCKVFGHDIAACKKVSKEPKEKWVPKTSVTSNKNNEWIC